jgi:hypothetical protein
LVEVGTETARRKVTQLGVVVKVARLAQTKLVVVEDTLVYFSHRSPKLTRKQLPGAVADHLKIRDTAAVEVALQEEELQEHGLAVVALNLLEALADRRRRPAKTGQHCRAAMAAQIPVEAAAAATMEAAVVPKVVQVRVEAVQATLVD